MTGHKSDAVRLYKHTSETLMEKACKSVVQKVVGESPQNKNADFDIDEVDLTKGEKIERFVRPSAGGRCHKEEFCHVKQSGKCGGLCQFLKKTQPSEEEKARHQKDASQPQILQK